MRISDWSSDVCSSDLLKPKSWPTASQIPKKVSRRRKRLVVSLSIFFFPFGCGHRPLPMQTASQRPCQFLQSLEFPGFFPFSPRLAAILFVIRFPSNGKCHHLLGYACTRGETPDEN